MKVLIICFAITALIVGMGFSCYHYLNSSIDKMLVETKNLRESVDDGKWRDAQKSVSLLHKDWQKKEQSWTLLINHQEVDNIELTLGRVESYISSKNKLMALGEISALEHWIKHIPHKEAMTLSNIF